MSFHTTLEPRSANPTDLSSSNQPAQNPSQPAQSGAPSRGSGRGRRGARRGSGNAHARPPPGQGNSNPGSRHGIQQSGGSATRGRGGFHDKRNNSRHQTRNDTPPHLNGPSRAHSSHPTTPNSPRPHPPDSSRAPDAALTNTEATHSSQFPPRRNQASRRKAFGSKLTDSTPVRSPTQTGAGAHQDPPPDLNELSLSKRLTVELLNSAYDCPICISSVTRHQPIYHCPHCFAIFHLGCATKWASCSVTETSARALLLRDRDGTPCSDEAARGDWRCPGCQHRHIGKESIPQKYLCWCGKAEDPRRNQRAGAGGRHQPASKIPHGCGTRCGKVTAKGCVHGCNQECHPGSCEPCTAVIKSPCHCQKTQLSVRCSQLYNNRKATDIISSELISCGQPCGQKLPCGMHFCTQSCHPGECPACEVIRDKSCYCGQVTLPDQKCSQSPAQDDPYRDKPEQLTCVSADGSEWLGEFGCKEPCRWKYDCGIHPCESACHPHTSPAPLVCPLSPSVLKTCPCGSTLLSRRACTDPIETCGNACGKVMDGCGHKCPNPCHLGRCGPCKSLVTTVCRCGKDRIVRQCTEVEQLREAALAENALESAEDQQDPLVVAAAATEYRCERICRVLRHCGKHTCNRRCCPLAFLENVFHGGNRKKTVAMRQHEDEDPLGLHLCDLRCNKKLSCGIHNCQLRDHKGACPSCLQASFDELVCHCGATVIQPPVPCGTQIKCTRPCTRPGPACGHPKTPHSCHEEPACPPCPYLTAKPCMCDKRKVVKNARCSQGKVSCGQTCDKLLLCGAHRCSRKCHPAGECEACDRICLKPKKYCGHGCRRKCHAPSACPTDAPCETIVEIKCPCGHISQQVQCLSCDAQPDGKRNRTVQCNDDCILFQRNAALASALEIKSPKSPAEPAPRWTSALMQLYGTHIPFAKAVEGQLEEFLRLPITRSHQVVSTWSKTKRALLYEMAAQYGLKCDPLDEEPRFRVKLTRDAMSAVPKQLLSAAHAAATQTKSAGPDAPRPLLRTTLPSDGGSERGNPSRMNAVLLEGVFGHDEGSLRRLMEPVLGRTMVGLRWIGDEDVAVTVGLAWPPAGGAEETELSAVRSALGGLLDEHPFCRAVGFARVSPDGHVVARSLDGSEAWTAVGRPEAARWDGRGARSVASSNPFEMLAGQPKGGARRGGGGGGGGGGAGTGGWATAGPGGRAVIGGGYNKPPMAVLVSGMGPLGTLNSSHHDHQVLAPSGSRQRRGEEVGKEQEEEAVAENWEDGE